ncbi:2-dehydro-3-deoxygalactonokinase [Ramlibacter sp.]|uniref:2-dehydro-3-deoxygalactonokinase n=1 Tax=Ramlibacter sp. TaxID=1917967 RepID=UPI002B89BE8C|nr:2-dehydro-3-deoxygalactonokinase [Ramlibacter sp.]HWI83284.1 2-dehydro-3-deoxygalactonokinase [Ramlibacter sp.]
MNHLVALDWGTSSLRAARLAGDGRVLEERSLPRGILTVPPGGFPQVFDEVCGDWMRPPEALALICGMAGSRQGWMEAPYCPCPAGFADIAAHLTWIEPGRIAMVPGLTCEQDGVPDVMRGEETQVLGALELLELDAALLVLPGTHSKWVQVAGGRIERFSTFMTGEFYALLRQHSILGRTMPPEDGELDETAFERGVSHALRSSTLLHAAFSARTLALFERLPAAARPSYLSGLVIGEELAAQQLAGGTDVVVVGSEALTRRYEIGLRLLGATAQRAGAQATWRGLRAIASTLEHRQ